MANPGMNFVPMLLGAVLLWDFFTRVQQLHLGSPKNARARFREQKARKLEEKSIIFTPNLSEFFHHVAALQSDPVHGPSEAKLTEPKIPTGFRLSAQGCTAKRGYPG